MGRLQQARFRDRVPSAGTAETGLFAERPLEKGGAESERRIPR